MARSRASPDSRPCTCRSGVAVKHARRGHTARAPGAGRRRVECPMRVTERRGERHSRSGWHGPGARFKGQRHTQQRRHGARDLGRKIVAEGGLCPAVPAAAVAGAAAPWAVALQRTCSMRIGLHSRAEPPPLEHTRSMGQPMLTSTKSQSTRSSNSSAHRASASA